MLLVKMAITIFAKILSFLLRAVRNYFDEITLSTIKRLGYIKEFLFLTVLYTT